MRKYFELKREPRFWKRLSRTSRFSCIKIYSVLLSSYGDGSNVFDRELSSETLDYAASDAFKTLVE